MGYSLVFCLFFLSWMSQAASMQVYSFKLSDYKKQMHELRDLDVDILGVDHAEQIVDIRLTLEKWKKIEKDWIKFLVAESNNVNWSADFAPDSQYHNPEEARQLLQDLAFRFPDIATMESIGSTHEGRDIWAMKISDNVELSEGEEPALLFNGMHHAREVMTTEVILDAAQTLLTEYGQDDDITAWVDGNEIWLVPSVNPDGGHKVHDGSNMWRKNTRDGHGVDLNRNYPFNWDSCDGSSGSKYSDTYRGEKPASELETQALMRLVERIQPVFNISYHSYSEMVLYPYGCRPLSVESDMARIVGRSMANVLVKDDDSGTYSVGTPWDLLYNADGSDIDWMFGVHNVLAYVIEVNSRSQGFHPPFSWRDPTVKKMRESWKHLLQRSNGPGIRGSLPSLMDDREVLVSLKSLSDHKLAFAPRRLNKDGSFHFVTEPGHYKLVVTKKGQKIREEVVQVKLERINL